MLPDLDQLLAFKHEGAVRRFERENPSLAERAEELFSDALRYLWLCRKLELDRTSRPQDPDLDFLAAMHEEMRDIDNMWHAFILYTRDYHDFCERYFGRYMHHQPDVATERPMSPEAFEIELTRFLSFTYDHLGEETVRRWFAMHVEEPLAAA